MTDDIKKEYLSKLREIHSNIFPPCPIKNINFTYGQNGLLNYLVDNNKITPSEISKLFNIGSGRVGNMLNNLEEKGFIYKIQDSKDKRRYVIKITPYGRKYILDGRKEFDEFFNKVLDEYGEDKFKELMSNLYEFSLIFKNNINKEKGGR